MTSESGTHNRQTRKRVSAAQKRKNRTPQEPRHWLTWTEFVDAAEAVDSETRQRVQYKSDATVTYRRALELARRGAPVDLPEIDRLVGAVQAKVRAPKDPEWDYDVAGGEVDISRAVAGEPEDMIADAPHRMTRQGRAVRLVIPVSSCFFQDKERVRTRGVAVMALVDCLQRARLTLEIWAVDARHAVSDGPGESRRVQAILLKPANAPLDMGRVMFALAHDGMPRRLCPGVMNPTLMCSGAFCPGPYTARVTDLPDDRGRGQTIVITADGGYGAGTGRWSAGEEGAVEWVQRQLDVVTGETEATKRPTRDFANT